MKIIVASKRNGAVGEYVGRPSPLGNPFSHTDGTLAQYRVATREEAVAKYADWLHARIMEGNRAVTRELERLGKLAEERGELTLVCWCAPLPCHADVIREVLLS